MDYANYYMKFNILNIESLIKFWKLLFEKKVVLWISQIFICILKIIIWIFKKWYLDVKIHNSILKIEIEITNFKISIQFLLIDYYNWYLNSENCCANLKITPYFDFWETQITTFRLEISSFKFK